MLFLNSWLLIGLVAAAIPIIIHMMRRQAAKPIDWGAMRFLFDTISVRRRKMEWEDLLLMASRCLLLALIALAIARPFLTPDSQVPWLVVLPLSLVALALFGASYVLSNRKTRWLIRVTAILLMLLTAALIYWEKILNLRRFEASGRRDVAIIIDASSSMEITRAGKSAFQHAIAEAKQIVTDAPRGTAFIVVLGGPSPEAKTAAPLTHRADVLGVLDSLQPVGGSFRAYEALGVATIGLAEGHNRTKEIIVFSDAQRSGWQLENPNAWNELEQAWAGLPAKPKLLLRQMSEPENFLNVALTNWQTSRSVLGTDREVLMKAEITNTGKSAITPGEISLFIDDKKTQSNPLGLLLPGQITSVEFRYRFTKSGNHVVRAEIDVKDDLLIDNRIERVMTIQDSLPVLLIDGNPAGTFFERASGYMALALAPSSSLVNGNKAGEKFLMAPRVVPAATLRVEDIDDADVFVLADVSRLPEKIAARLAAKIIAGAGMIVIAGPRSEKEFYNHWTSIDGPLLPMKLSDEQTDATGITPASATFVHESLKLFVKNSDMEMATIKRWRKTTEGDRLGTQAAAFSNGDVFLASHAYGSGRVMMSTCAFDARAGNLPAKRAFVPLVHELVTWTAGGGLNLNVASSWSPSVVLNQSGGGLSAVYARIDDRKERTILERIDPAIDFDWTNESPGKAMPRDRFVITWKALLLPPVTGEYLFEANVNDRLTMKIGEDISWNADTQDILLGKIRLEAGKSRAVEIRYEQDYGPAFVNLYWTSPGGKKELIPSAAWIPLLEKNSAPMKVIDPKGLARQASIRAGRRGQELKIDGAAVPGVYQITTDESLRNLLGSSSDAALPVAVIRNPEESSFSPMLADDVAMVRKHVDFLQPSSVNDILAVLQGKGYGREIAKWLALSALAIFLLESILSRWVSKSRRTAEDVRVDFGEDTLWKGGLR